MAHHSHSGTYKFLSFYSLITGNEFDIVGILQLWINYMALQNQWESLAWTLIYTVNSKVYPESNENSLSLPKSHSLACSVYCHIAMILFRTKLYIAAHTLPCSRTVNRKWHNWKRTVIQHPCPKQQHHSTAQPISSVWSLCSIQAESLRHHTAAWCITQLTYSQKRPISCLVYQLHDIFNCWFQNKIRSYGRSYSVTSTCKLITGHIMEQLL